MPRAFGRIIRPVPALSAGDGCYCQIQNSCSISKLVALRPANKRSKARFALECFAYHIFLFRILPGPLG